MFKYLRDLRDYYLKVLLPTFYVRKLNERSYFQLSTSEYLRMRLGFFFFLVSFSKSYIIPACHLKSNQNAESQVPDLQTKNLHLNKTFRRSVCTLKLEKHWPVVVFLSQDGGKQVTPVSEPPGMLLLKSILLCPTTD